MRRRVVLSLLWPPLVLVGLAACDRGGTSVPTSSPSAPGSTASSSPGTPSPTPTASSPSATTSPTPRPIPPAWASPIVDDAAPEELLDAQLVPPEATLTARITLPAGEAVADEIAVAFVIGTDPFAAEHGFAVWRRFPEPPAWSVVFAFADAPEEGVLGIDVQGGDLTGDGHAEAVTFEQTGGSGACGRWRVVATIAGDTSQVFSRRTCDTEIAIVDGALEMREAVYGPDDPHCCPRAFRYTTLAWDGSRFVATDVREEPVGST